MICLREILNFGNQNIFIFCSIYVCLVLSGSVDTVNERTLVNRMTMVIQIIVVSLAASAHALNKPWLRRSHFNIA